MLGIRRKVFNSSKKRCSFEWTKESIAFDMRPFIIEFAGAPDAPVSLSGSSAHRK
jgi:hypothetical protein